MADTNKLGPIQQRIVDAYTAKVHARIDVAFATDPDQAKFWHDQVNAEAGKVDPANLAAFLQFLMQLMAVLLPLLVPK